ncbi:metallophosphoesterase family protein [Cellulomonas phragmiteti]|nr:metallophosphoesterase family protein [Cellulomonas phragmiteti]
MRIAVMSDVHGNLLALDAVLDDITSHAVDVTVNLGDLLSGPLCPRETADRLRELDLLTVRGNHERQVLETPVGGMGPSDRHAHDALAPEHLTWLAGLPLTLELDGDVLAFHGSPSDDLQYLLHTVEVTGARDATTDEVMDRLGPHARRRLLLCGHTHLPGSLALPTGVLVVNPGSVGWPAYEDDAPHPHVMEAGTPHARYALVEDVDGRWDVTFRAVEYDWDRAADTADGHGRPDVAHALRTGRLPR